MESMSRLGKARAKAKTGTRRGRVAAEMNSVAPSCLRLEASGVHRKLLRMRIAVERS